MDSELVNALKEGLLTTNLVLDKTPALDVPLWIVGVTLSRNLTTANGILMGNLKRTWTVRSHVVEFVVHLQWPDGAD